MSGPSLSVLMPNYNHARFLPAALDAILAQSYRPLEVLVVDDGSTDGSVALLKRYEERAPGLVRLIENERNLGVVPTMQRLLTLAGGTHLHFAAADDVVLPGLYARSMAQLALNPTAGLCSTLSLTMSASGNLQGVLKTPVVLRRDGFIPAGAVLGVLRRHGSWFMGNTTIVRRAALLEAGGFRPELGPYCDGFVYPAIALRHGACFIPEPLGIWRRMEQSYSQQMNGRSDEVLRFVNYAEALMRTEYPDLFPSDYIERWRREMFFSAAVCEAGWNSDGKGFSQLERLITSNSLMDHAFRAVYRTWPSLSRTLARPYLFAKLRGPRGAWRVAGRRLTHLQLAAHAKLVQLVRRS